MLIRKSRREEEPGRPRRWWGSFEIKHLGLIFIILCSLGALMALRAADPFIVQSARDTSFDLLQRLSPREYVESPVRIVDIDDRSLKEFGQWPWPRNRLAELVDRLHAAGAAAVAFDVLFVEPDRLSPSRLLEDPGVRTALGLEQGSASGELLDYDLTFADALRRGNVVLGVGTSDNVESLPPSKGGFTYTGENPVGRVARIRGGGEVLPELAEAAAGLGAVNISNDYSAGVVRKNVLLWSDGERLFPGMVSESLRVAQGAHTIVVHADQEGAVQSVRVGGLEAPTSPQGELYLYVTPSRPERFISAVDVFDNERLRELAPELTGAIVLVGTSAAGLFDLHKTPLGENVPGVELQAQALEQIINKQFLRRHSWTGGAELLALVVASFTVSATTIFAGARLALLFGAIVSFMIAFGAWYGFRNFGVLLDVSFPLLGGLAVWFIATACRYVVADREKREIRGAFSHYVHPSVLKDIERNHSQVRLGGEICDLTVLFTDVRNFTPLSERLSPEDLVGFVNNLFNALGRAITEEKGVIDKFIGDSVMAFWNAPLRQSDHAARACRAALKMRAAIREMTDRNAFGLPEELRQTPIQIGVGVNTGRACVGNVGSADRFNYSAIGDAVNVAARAESACKDLGYDLVVCRSTADESPGFAFLHAGRVRLKGKAAPVDLMILVGDADLQRSPRFADLARRYAEVLARLGEGDAAAAEEAIADCRELATALEPGLGRYLDRLRSRAEDFRIPSDTEPELVPAG